MFYPFESSTASLLFPNGLTFRVWLFIMCPKLRDDLFHSVSNLDMQLDVPVFGLYSLSGCIYLDGSFVDAVDARSLITIETGPVSNYFYLGFSELYYYKPNYK